MHAEVSGTVDFYEKDDPACLKRLRSLVAHLPEAEAAKQTDANEKGDRAGQDPDAVYDLIGLDGQKQYDARDLLASIIDADSLDEYKADYGKTLVTDLRAYRRTFGRDRRQSAPPGAHEEGRHSNGRRHLFGQR